MRERGRRILARVRGIFSRNRTTANRGAGVVTQARRANLTPAAQTAVRRFDATTRTTTSRVDQPVAASSGGLS